MKRKRKCLPAKRVKKPERQDDYELVVTRIHKRWHARLFFQGNLVDEMACANRVDIGWICRQMLRWQDKAGGNKFTSAARKRIVRGPVGQVWYSGQLKRP